MNSDSAQTPGQDPAPTGAARADALGGFELLIDTLEVDTPWEVNRRIYEAWRIYDPWPPGMLLHMAGPSGADVRIQAVWRNAKFEAEHMTTTGAERFTDVVGVLASEFKGSPPDILPVNHRLLGIVLGPLARHFFDIGADLDEGAGRQFGTVLTAVDFAHDTLTAGELEGLWRRCGLGETVPEGLIVQLSWVDAGMIRETQLWRSEELARRFVDEVFARQPEVAAAPERLAAVRFREIKRLAIDSGELERSHP